MSLFLHVPQVLTGETLAAIAPVLTQGTFMDGRLTAGSPRIAERKHNQELDPRSPGYTAAMTQVRDAILRHPLVQSYGFPRHLFSLICSRYGVGMSYGAHVDAPIMEVIEGDQTQPRRTDLSLTLFLAPPEGYAGGELVIATPTGDMVIKLAAGDMVLYPASTLHRVNPVTQGVRWAIVGWIQSQIRDPSQRELLYDLGTAYRGVQAALPDSTESQLLLKTYANLLRRWSQL